VSRRARAAFVVAALSSLILASAAAASPDHCPNAEIRSQQGAAGLPACRAYELANPPGIDSR
jgi:hypothetical protein